jgi:hypothetical protein
MLYLRSFASSCAKNEKQISGRKKEATSTQKHTPAPPAPDTIPTTQNTPQ